MVACLFVERAAFAAEYIRQESPQPASAKGLEVSIDHAFTQAPSSDRLLMKNLKRLLDDKPEFWRDAKLSFDLRNYLFERRNASDNKPEAYVVGGQLTFESGWWNNLGISASYYNSTEIDADGPNTALLAPGQENINVLGEANLRYRFTDTFLEGSVVKLYRQTLNLPFINKHDIRQVPAAHEAYTISRTDSQLDYIVGHVTKFKDYDSDDFVDMAEAAGAVDSDEGVSIAGARYNVGESVTFGAANYYGWDTFNTFFAEGTYHTALAENLDLRLSGQFTHQRSVGDELVSEFDTRQFAAKAAVGWRGSVITVAGSIVDDEAGIRKPWGGSPSYLSIQRLDFDRANEKSLLLGLSYNTNFFSSLGLSSYINIARGWDAEDPITGFDLPDRTEYDITVDYKPPAGFLEGLWVRMRYNYIDIEDDGEKVHDFRLIINYTIPFI
ncbi:MAG: OprD family outer membrane porin [Gammaproteobacteria bacterium]|nr:OprD family outer membrane porin [Gammaproteobacteria bacterium]